MADEKQRFYKLYSNLPLNLRENVAAVVGDEPGEPVSWRVAKLEIDEDTEKGKEILKKLEELKII